MQAGRKPVAVAPDWEHRPSAFAGVSTPLEEYFAGTRTRFELDLALIGTSFQRRVWTALAEIPYGQTSSYGKLAGRMGQPSAARAVGLETDVIRSR